MMTARVGTTLATLAFILPAVALADETPVPRGRVTVGAAAYGGYGSEEIANNETSPTVFRVWYAGVAVEGIIFMGAREPRTPSTALPPTGLALRLALIGELRSHLTQRCDGPCIERPVDPRAERHGAVRLGGLVRLVVAGAQRRCAGRGRAGPTARERIPLGLS